MVHTRKEALVLFAALFLLLACIPASGGACPRVVRIAGRNVTELDLQTSLRFLQKARDVWDAGRTGEGGMGGATHEEGASEVVVQQVVAACCEAMLALPDYARKFALGVALSAEGDDWQAVRMLKASHRAAPGFVPPLLLLEELLDLKGLSGEAGDKLQGLIPAEIQDDLFGFALRRLAFLPQVVEMHCIEASSVRVQQLRRRLAASGSGRGGYAPMVHHAFSVPPERCLAAHQLRAFGSLRAQLPEEDRAVFDQAWNHPSAGAGAGAGGAGGAGETELEKLVREADDRVYGERAYLAQAGVDLTGPGGITEVLRAELAAVWGANIVALDDTLGVKHLASRIRLLASEEYRLLEQDTGTRNGFAIFIRRAWEHAPLVMHAFTTLRLDANGTNVLDANGSNVGELPPGKPRGQSSQAQAPQSEHTVTTLHHVETALGATGDGGGGG
ncbi:hypothetical protein T484DRAFT_1904851, partial [Baffinella frigidus]